jgi:hypothetical protein
VLSLGTKLEEQLAAITKTKARKQTRIQQGSTMVYGKAVNYVAASAALVVNLPKKTCHGSALNGEFPIQQHCGTCGKSGHNARTRQKDVAISSEPEASTQYISSDSSDSNNNNQS